MKSPVLFDQALERAASFVATAFPFPNLRPILVRDVYGRIRIAVDDRRDALDPDHLQDFSRKFHDALGAYGPGEQESDVFLLGSGLFSPDSLFSAAELSPLSDHPEIRLLERQVTGQDWLRAPIETKTERCRAALYGVKGGVGRSTALAIWAKHLADVKHKRVLVIDLDLESPGVASMLLPEARYPELGLVDHLIEEAVGQGDEILDRLWSQSPLADDNEKGEIWVVPAHGRDPGNYLAKLSRIYQGVSEGPVDFAERISSSIDKIEMSLTPDVVLFDGRAGLHDIAAMVVTRLQAVAFLFAVGTPQTLCAYRLLFDNFKRHPHQLKTFQDRLQTVAALVPPTDRETYLRNLKTGLYDLFATHIYEEDIDPEVFNYSLDDEDAPHNPIPIHWYQWFMDFDPIHKPDALTKEEVHAAFSAFTHRATELLLPDGA
jgi:hypothetical protein